MQLKPAILIALALALGASARAHADDAPPSQTPPSQTPPSQTPPTTPPAPDPDGTSQDDLDWNAVSAGLASAKDLPRHEEDTDTNTDPPTTGALQGGVYGDSDKTTVFRSLALIASSWGHWTLDARAGADAVTSASIDVRSSPQLSKVDVMTSASGRTSTSGGQMSDTRYEVTTGGGWNDTRGHTAHLGASFASERDYTSASASLNGSIDVLDRTTTLLAGVTATDNRVSSVLDANLHEKMLATGWSAGVARVLTPNDALRLRYDGRNADGFQSSPYRYVRFGDWSVSTGAHEQLVFTNTIGSADGLAEHVPDKRLSHALVFEWVHALADHVALHPTVRAGHDSWGVDSLTAGLELRVAEPSWRLQLGYRYYRQTAADFFQDKYVDAPAMYTYYTSDKELGDQSGHLGTLGLSLVLSEPDGPHQSRLLLDTRVDAFRYDYPGFTLLPSRTSVFASVGLTWEQ